MKADSKQLNELMARCLSGACSPDELRQLASMLSANPDLKNEYELIHALFGKEQSAVAPEEKHFKRITKRLKDEGLM